MRKNLIADNLDVAGVGSFGGSRVSLGASTNTYTTPILLANGALATPSLAFSAATNTGLYYDGSNLNIGVAGTRSVALTQTTGILVFSSGQLLAGGSSSDVILYRDAANTLALKNGNSDQLFRIYGANGGYWERGCNSELLTIAAAASSTTSGNLLPANSLIEAVVVRVTVVIPTATTFSVGVTAKADRFDSGIAVAADTTAVCLQHHNTLDTNGLYGKTQTAAAKVVITPSATPADNTGRVRVEVFFNRFVAPTS